MNGGSAASIAGVEKRQLALQESPRAKHVPIASPDDPKLDRFVAAFENEAELRTAVIGLLERMPHVTGVRHTHGSAWRVDFLQWKEIRAEIARLQPSV